MTYIVLVGESRKQALNIYTQKTKIRHPTKNNGTQFMLLQM